MGVVAVLSFGLSALFAVLNLDPLVPVTFTVGFFLLVPLIYLLEDDFPLVSSKEEKAESDPENPVETLKQRFAEGEISQEEFEYRLEKLLETDQEEPPLTEQLTRVERETQQEREFERN